MAKNSKRQNPVLVAVVTGLLIIAVLSIAVFVFVNLKNRERNASSGGTQAVYLIKGDSKSSNSYERVDKLSYTDSVKYTKKDLEKLDSLGLEITRNEIYARHGKMFADQDLQTYFDRQGWYQAKYSPEEFDESKLNEVEIYNIEEITKCEMAIE